jgi:ATP-dependent DNA helicase RecG
VCPRIEADVLEGEDTGSAAARARELALALAPAAVTLIHGAMRPEARRRAMRAMRSGDAQVLVGTTVVEVGVDVPEATLMVVEGAERFGLSQLHQLRGRVGRGDRPGRCIVLHGDLAGAPLGRRRLEALCRLSSGADVARADLELRGAGDLGGTRQSGDEAGLLYLDPAAPPPWLARIDADARAIFAADPALEADAHRGLASFARRLTAGRAGTTGKAGKAGQRSAPAARTPVRDEAG